VKLPLKSFLIVFTVVLITTAINSCKKEEQELTLTVITGNVSGITYHSAVCGVEWNGSDENLAEGGVCYSKKPGPTLNDGVSRFDPDRKETPSGLWFGPLAPNTKYHVRAYLNIFTGSAVKTFYGQDIEFMTLEFDKTIKFNPSLTYGSVSDIEGNAYKTIQIGKQVWMAENLRSTRLNDNTPIPKVTFPETWSDIKTPGYNWCEEDSINFSTTYGARYNWFTVYTGRLCPAGWHVPSDYEWETLVAFLGGPDVASTKLKETGNIHWNSPNDGATNESGFTALPCLNAGYFDGWWSTTRINSYDPPVVWCYWIHNDLNRLNRSENNGSNGINVRCLQN